jgi:uracil-DNA glycosylase
VWLPAAALEDEETRALLGEARSDAERLDRALFAYAALLGQDRRPVTIRGVNRGLSACRAGEAPGLSSVYTGRPYLEGSGIRGGCSLAPVT